MQATTNYELDGAPIDFMANGAWDNDKAELITGDFRQLVYAIRKDVTTKLLTEAVLQDPETGDIVYNLAQQDMVALRVVMRDRKSTRLNSSHVAISYAVFCLKKKKE